MTERNHLQKLATDIQNAVACYDPTVSGPYDQIQDAVEKLRRAIVPPAQFARNEQTKLAESLVVYMAVKIGLLRALAKDPGKPMSSSDLATATSYDASFTARIMRMVASAGFAEEAGYQTYVANAVTVFQSSEAADRSLTFANGQFYHMAGKVDEYVEKFKPCDLTKSPSLYEYSMGESFWETLKNDPDKKKSFDCRMTLTNTALGVPWHKKYDGIRERLTGASPPVIVDIGGNKGLDLQRFADDYKNLNCELVLEDLPENFLVMPSTLDARIKPLEYDFFTKQPVKGASIYYMRRVLHDWEDEPARQILSNTAAVMNRESRFLIHEIVMSNTNERPENLTMYIAMMLLLRGKQRTTQEWEDLFASVEPPLKILKIWSAPHDRTGLIETGLRD